MSLELVLHLLGLPAAVSLPHSSGRVLITSFQCPLVNPGGCRPKGWMLRFAAVASLTYVYNDT